MDKYKVLFVCVHNSARSQMAEAWLNHLYGDLFEAHSAGFRVREYFPVEKTVFRQSEENDFFSSLLV